MASTPVPPSAVCDLVGGRRRPGPGLATGVVCRVRGPGHRRCSMPSRPAGRPAPRRGFGELPSASHRDLRVANWPTGHSSRPAKFGAGIYVPRARDGISRADEGYQLTLADGTTVSGRMVVVATGARYRRLDLPGLAAFEGTSVYYAATQVRHCGARTIRSSWSAAATFGPARPRLFLARRRPTSACLVRGGATSPPTCPRYLADGFQRSTVDVAAAHCGAGSHRGRVAGEAGDRGQPVGARRTIEARALCRVRRRGTQQPTGWAGSSPSTRRFVSGWPPVQWMLVPYPWYRRARAAERRLLAGNQLAGRIRGGRRTARVDQTGRVRGRRGCDGRTPGLRAVPGSGGDRAREAFRVQV